jgi:hypothetical protein
MLEIQVGVSIDTDPQGNQADEYRNHQIPQETIFRHWKSLQTQLALIQPTVCRR